MLSKPLYRINARRPTIGQLGRSPVHFRDQHGQLGHSPVHFTGGSLASIFQRPAYGQLGHSPVHYRDQNMVI